MKLKVEFYKDKRKEFRFRIVAKNGKILAESSESYKRIAGCKKAFTVIANALAVLEYDMKDLFEA